MALARILLVDDDEIYVNAMTRLMIRRGYEVVSATRPSQALEIVKNSPQFDVVVSDVTMPEMCGTELVREIAQLTPGTARILISGGKVDPAELPEGVPLLRKPLLTEELICAVQAILDRSAIQGQTRP